MELTLNDLTVNPPGLDRESLLSSWAWAMKRPILPVFLTAMGDVFGQDSTGAVYFVDTCCGTVKKVTDSGDEFKQQLSNLDFVNMYFYPQSVGDLRDEGLVLQQGQCYSHKHTLVLGGKDELENIEITDFTVHVNVMGKIHAQVKDLPPGSLITDVEIEGC